MWPQSIFTYIYLLSIPKKNEKSRKFSKCFVKRYQFATKKLGRDLWKDLPWHRETWPQTGHCSSHRPNTSASWNKLSTSSSHEQTIQEIYVLFSRWHSFFFQESTLSTSPKLVEQTVAMPSLFRYVDETLKKLFLLLLSTAIPGQ